MGTYVIACAGVHVEDEQRWLDRLSLSCDCVVAVVRWADSEKATRASSPASGGTFAATQARRYVPFPRFTSATETLLCKHGISGDHIHTLSTPL